MSTDGIRTEVFTLVLEFFRGDREKAELWMSTANPLMGRVPPDSMIEMGLGPRLLRWVKESLSSNEGPECKTALRGGEVICLTHNQRYAGCVLDERDRLRAEVGRLNEKVDELRLHLKAIEEEGCEVQEKERGRLGCRCVVRVQEGTMSQKHCCRSCMAYFALHETLDLRIKEMCVKCEHPRSAHTSGGGCISCQRRGLPSCTYEAASQEDVEADKEATEGGDGEAE